MMASAITNISEYGIKRPRIELYLYRIDIEGMDSQGIDV